MNLKWLFSDGLSDTDSDDSDYDMETNCDTDYTDLFKFALKRGKKPLHEVHPTLVPCIEEFIKQNSPAANLKRKVGTMYTNGVSLAQIAEHVKCNIPALNGKISRTTISRLCRTRSKKPVNSRRRNFSLVNAKLT